MGSYEYITWPGDKTTPGPDLFPGWSPTAHNSKVVHGMNGAEWVEVDRNQDPTAYNIAAHADQTRNDILAMVRQDGGRVFYYDGSGYPPLRGYNPGDTARGREKTTGSILVEYKWNGLEWIQQRLTDGMISSLDVGKLTAGTANIQKVVADTIWAGIIQAKSIVANKITGELIEANTIRGDHIAANSISAEKLQTGSITAESGIIKSLDAGKITTGFINGQRIAARSITAAQLAAGSITADSAVIDSISASKITTGTLKASLFDADTLRGQTFIGGRFIGGDFLLDPETSRQDMRFGRSKAVPFKNESQEFTREVIGISAFSPTTEQPILALGVIGNDDPALTLYGRQFTDGNRYFSQLSPGQLYLGGVNAAGTPTWSYIRQSGQDLAISTRQENVNTPLSNLLMSPTHFYAAGNYRGSTPKWMFHLTTGGHRSDILCDGDLHIHASAGYAVSIDSYIHSRFPITQLDWGAGGNETNVFRKTEINGDLHATGRISADHGKSFVIRHPTKDNHILVYTCTESPYNGIEYWDNATLPESGEMTVELPEYFDKLHDEDVPTSIFTSNGVKVLGPVEGGKFNVKGEAGTWFSWQVKAARRIPWAPKMDAECTEDDAVNKYDFSERHIEGLPQWEQ